MIIYVTEADEIEGEALEMLKQSGHELLIDKESALAKATTVGALYVRTYTQVTVEFLDQFPNTKYVLRAGVGLDNIDTKECQKRGIVVINSPGANANAVAEYVVAGAISILRNFAAQQESLRQGAWRKKEFMGVEFKGRTLGLVGCGNVGQLIAHKLSSWDLKEIIGYDPYLTKEQLSATGIRKCELDEVVSESDVLSLHVPLIPETKHLINRDAFGRMKAGSVLINAARGGVVDEVALIEALKEGHISGAVLDVFEHEPDVAQELLAFSNLVATPHIGGYTHEANKEVSLAPVRELLRQLTI